MTVTNREFHFALFEISAMPRLVRMIRILWDSTDVYRSVYFAVPVNRHRVDREHRALLAALRRGDAEAAVAVLDGHRAAAVAAIAR